MAKLTEPQILTEFVKNKVFNSPVDLADHIDPPALFQKGEKVNFLNPNLKNNNDLYEIIGFYDGGNVVDQNTASPYNTSYGVRIKNIKTGQEYPTSANYLRRTK